ncbi:uncharacterized protein DUF4192 [Micromonospora sp. Llam0]|uniref:DUF4192 domain-containing protein n=1 Tax=Micromonospora sp. Llam0 TaxID=2485143 RepID=UPI000FBB5B32|nr:DUF4192 domain-containing protein [Micromonospora sp. Llam0]ROO52756.1 uncharacterized protein DUF4192 [Micromonospora sp. Llam0]
MVEPRNLRLSSPDDLIAAVPYIIGFTPTNSLLCILVDDQRIMLAARLDLPDPSEAHTLAAPAAQTATMLSRYGSTAFLIGYGRADRVAPAADLLTTALRAADVDVCEVLRVDDDRYWCLCGDADCADGVAYNPSGTVVPAQATYLGIAPLPDRAALEQLIAPVTGPERERMRFATGAALRRLTALRDDPIRVAGTEPPPVPPEHLVQAGITVVRQAHDAAARGDTLSDDDTAWLTAVLLITEVRDYAWTTCDGSDVQRQLWIDVTRRAMPQMSAAPACLLSITAYLAGDGAMANIAVDRALHAHPDYRLAHLLRDALQSAIPPHLLTTTN